MKTIRVRMLKTRDQLEAGQFYNLPGATADFLIREGVAIRPDIPPVGPTEVKPAGPTEIKVKKNFRRAPTGKGF